MKYILLLLMLPLSLEAYFLGPLYTYIPNVYHCSTKTAKCIVVSKNNVTIYNKFLKEIDSYQYILKDRRIILYKVAGFKDSELEMISSGHLRYRLGPEDKEPVDYKILELQ